MKLKMLIVMGLISMLKLGGCVHAQQPQYWGESPYNLENVDFNTDVAKFHSKEQDITNFNLSDELDRSKRMYIVERYELGDTVLFNYHSPETRFSDVMAKFGKFEFPYIGMLADKRNKMVGIMAKTRINTSEEIDELLFALADKFGSECNVERKQRTTKLIWVKDAKRVQLIIKQPDPERSNAVLVFSEDENGKRTLTGGGSEPYAWYEVSLFIAKEKYAHAIKKCVRSGVWIFFSSFNTTLESISKGMFDDEIIVDIDQSDNTFDIPNGTLPKFKAEVGESAGNQDFYTQLGYYIATHYDASIPGAGLAAIRFVIGRDGKAKHVEILNEVSEDIKYKAKDAINKLPVFEPATQNGKRVAIRFFITLRFVE